MVEISRVPYLPAVFSNPFKRKHYTGAIDRVPISEQKKSLKGGEGLDYAIMNFVQQNLHTAFTDVFFPIVTMLGNHGLVWLCLIAALLLTKKYRRCGGMLLLTLAATFLLGEFILKPIIARPRPFVDNPNVLLLIPPPSGYSCPSNHSSSSFAVATMLCFHHKKAGIAALVLAFLIAFSRIFLFVHYPTDVIFGAILGILCSVLLYKGIQAWQHKYSKKYF